MNIRTGWRLALSAALAMLWAPALAGTPYTTNDYPRALCVLDVPTANGGTGRAQCVSPVDQSGNPVTPGDASAANQVTANGKLDTLHTDLGLVATAAAQATANSSLSSIATNTGARGQAAAAASFPVVLPSDPDIRPGPGTITAADVGSNTATGQNGASLITGTATANSTVSQAINGQSGARIQVTGTWVGSLEFDGSIDGGTTRFPIPMRVSSTGYTTSSITGNGPFYGDVSGLTNVYARATAWTSGTANVRMTFSATSGAVQLTNPAQVVDNTSGARLTVKAASTAPVAGDTAAVVDLRTPGYAAIVSSDLTRPSNTTTYTANTAWANATSGATYTTFTGVCRANGTIVLIPSIRVIDYANQTIKLSGTLWLFNVAPGTPINDNATFSIASADMANLSGQPVAFSATTVANQASGASGSTVASMVGTTYEAKCANADANLYGMVQVTNAYVPVSAEKLTITLKVVGAN